MAFTYYHLAALVTSVILLKWLRPHKLHAIPVAGPSDFLGSWISALKFLTSGWSIDVTTAGYRKYKAAIFRVPTLSRWNVFVSKPEQVQELCRAPESVLSMIEATGEDIEMIYTFTPNALDDDYHVGLIRTKFTRDIIAMYPSIRSEMDVAFQEHLLLPSDGDWAEIPALDTIMKIVCQTSNRAFVGEPLCRNPEWIKLNVEFTVSVMKKAFILKMFPPFLKPIVAMVVNNKRNIRKASKLVTPVIQERLKAIEEYGPDYPNKPVDFLSILLDEAKDGQRTLSDHILRIIIVNFAGIHTTSLSLTHVLYDLASHPEYAQPLREEVQHVIQEHGWTKAALNKMVKLDSLFKESQRWNGIGVAALSRKALEPYTFSDGTHIPAGTRIRIPTSAIHRDESIYERPDEFDGFRFAKLRDREGEGNKHHFVTTGTDYLAFGHGQHSCPGRFFAATELKSMMAYILLKYDVKFTDGVRPTNLVFSGNIVPDPNAKVMFRLRQKQ